MVADMSNMNKRISEVGQGTQNDFKKMNQYLDKIRSDGELNKATTLKMMDELDSLKEAMIQMVPILV